MKHIFTFLFVTLESRATPFQALGGLLALQQNLHLRAFGTNALE